MRCGPVVPSRPVRERQARAGGRRADRCAQVEEKLNDLKVVIGRTADFRRSKLEQVPARTRRAWGQ